MTPIDRTNAEERLARIERMVEERRATGTRHRLARALKLWRLAEARQLHAVAVAPTERVH